MAGNIPPINRKRPPKLSPAIQQSSQGSSLGQFGLQPATCTDGDNAVGATGNGHSCNLESTVRVSLGDDQKNILISPDSLVVMQQLGQGQYGIVERVQHQASGYQFAVKRVPLKSDDDNERRRLLMDVDILVKGTECKNIIKFYGALIWEGDLWILMELMDCSLDRFYRLAHKKVGTPTITSGQQHNKGGGGPQHQLSSSSTTVSPCSHWGPGNDSVAPDVELGDCEACNPVPEKVLGRMAADIVNALSYLYSIKVIHRDIKPSNILINRVGLIKLCDFGISGYLVNSVARTYEAGCRPYMAPERIDPPRDRTGYDIKSDVWSFGITMLEIATGRYPYQHARGFFEQLKCICSDEPPKLPEGRFSQHFEDFIRQCLKKDYQSRPKYDALETHLFIEKNKKLDISYFTERVLKEYCETT